MTLCNNDITIYRGEAFTIDYSILFPNGTPFIVSNEMSNPYFLISLSTHKGESQEVFNYWLPATKKFEYTKTLDIQEFKSVASTSGDAVYETFNDVTPPIGNFYWNGMYVEKLESDFAVYSNSKEPGVYKYISNNNSLEDYSCRIIHTFNTDDTKQWKSEKYYYTIQLVDGQDMRSYLLAIAKEHLTDMLGELDNMTNEELYNLLLNNNIIDELDITQPIAKINVSLPIMSPATINVIQYMQGGLL